MATLQRVTERLNAAEKELTDTGVKRGALQPCHHPEPRAQPLTLHCRLWEYPCSMDCLNGKWGQGFGPDKLHIVLLIRAISNKVGRDYRIRISESQA